MPAFFRRRRGAESVDRRCGRRDRQPGQYDSQACHVAALLPDLIRHADCDVLDLIGRDFRISLEQRVDDVRNHVVRPREIETAAKRLREPGTYVIDYYHFSLEFLFL